jgi:hypothetical protein
MTIFVLPTMYCTTYNSLTLWSRVLLEKLSVPELVKKHPAFYGTWRFITAFTTNRHLSPSTARPIQSMLPIQFLKINFNIILPSIRSSSKWSLSFVFLHQNPVCTYPLPHTCLHVPATLFFLIRSPKQYLVGSSPKSSDCGLNKHILIWTNWDPYLIYRTISGQYF